MKKIDGDEVLRIARGVAHRYRKRCWWADLDDLVQQASVAVLEARTTWDPQVGIPFRGYAARAASRQLTETLWKASSPLSGGLHDPHKNIAGVFATSLKDEHAPATESDPGAALDDYRWRLRVRTRLRKIASKTKGGDLALEVLVRGRKSGDVIRETGEDVYGAVHLTRRKVRTDAVLYKLLRRRPR